MPDCVLRTLLAALILSVAAVGAWPQSTLGTPAAATVWNGISSPVADPDKSGHADNIELVRDRIRITLLDGTVQLMQPINGRVFGASFHGRGRVQVEPPNAIEGQQLKLFAKEEKVNFSFTDATFSFTDDLADELAKRVKWEGAGANDDLYASRQKAREDLGEAALPRMLQGLTAADRKRTSYFLADLKLSGKDWVEFRYDSLDPEEIRILRWVDVGPFKLDDTWMHFPANNVSAAEAWKDPIAKEDFAIRAYNINASVTSGAELSATTKMTIEPRLAGLSVLVFEFDANLRMDSVKDGQGTALNFYQARETKDRYQSYGDYIAVVLPQPLAPGTPQTLEFHYAGKRAIRKAGSGNYFCESSGWYPELPNSFATRADFEMTFRSPKNALLVATGEKTSDTVDGGTRITTWKSEIPLAVAGFAYGDYKPYSDKAGDVAVQVYANREPDDLMRMVQLAFDSGAAEGAVGSLTPSSMAKTMGIEMANTVRLFSSYFGQFPYKSLAVASIPLSYSHGQGWPGLVYLWSASFLDSTQRHTIGLKDGPELTDFFRAHESSHQWWGQRVGWKSYHDQWLSEGFADFSGILYVQYRENMKEALNQWRQEKEKIRKKDTLGHSRESLGPIWMGQRIRSSITDGGAYQDLIYSKGGYVLHMLRMQLWDGRSADPDHVFKETMQDYCKTFDNKAASTEDFKAIVEKHMNGSMDADGNHKMDWFFNQYVYGTGEAQYTFRYSIDYPAEGRTHFKVELTRTGVPDSWKDVVPLYAHMGDKTIKMGNIRVTHPTETVDTTIQGKIDRVSINDYEDLLAEVKQ